MCGDESRKSADGVIWCLHSGILREINRENNSKTGILDGVAWVYDTRLLEQSCRNIDDLDRTNDEHEKLSNLMLLWEAPSLDARISSQAGLFSILNDRNESPNDFLNYYCKTHPDLLLRVVIEASAKPEIRDMLDQNNISERVLFPDIPGLCSWLKRYYSKGW